MKLTLLVGLENCITDYFDSTIEKRKTSPYIKNSNLINKLKKKKCSYYTNSVRYYYKYTRLRQEFNTISKQLSSICHIRIVSRMGHTDTTKGTVKVFLRQNRIPYCSLDFTDKHRLKLCKSYLCNIAIEDDLKVAKKLSTFVPVILFDTPSNQYEGNLKHIYRVKNWNEVIDILKNYYLEIN